MLASPSPVLEAHRPPLVELDDARIECAGGPLFDGVSCTAHGPRLGLVGPWDALFRLVGGDGRLTAGTARVNGVPVPAGVGTGRIGVALQDVPFPPRYKGFDYLTKSAQLAGLGGVEQRVRGVIEELGLTRVTDRRLRVMAPAERRAILIAHAILSDPEALVLQGPLDDLDPASAKSLAVVIERAAANRRLVVSAADASLGSPSRSLLDTMDAILGLSFDGLVRVVEPGAAVRAAGRYYVVAVPRRAGPFARELTQRGVEVTGLEAPGPTPAVVSRTEVGDRAGKLLIRLGNGVGTETVLDAALALDLPILHLGPAELPPPEVEKRSG